MGVGFRGLASAFQLAINVSTTFYIVRSLRAVFRLYRDGVE